jgi:hypothetical protein
VLVFNQMHCGCLARWLGQETALWISICSVSGCSSPATYCQPAAAADFIYCISLGGAATPTYCSRLCLFTVLPGTCSSSFFQCRVLPACYSCSPYLFKVCAGKCPSPTLWWSMHTSVTVASLVHSQIIVGGGQTHLLWQACLFTVCVGNCPSPTLLLSILHVSHCCKPFLPQAHWGQPPNPPSLAGLFI